MTLFDPGFIGNLEQRNRFVRSAIGELAANENEKKQKNKKTCFYWQ